MERESGSQREQVVAQEVRAAIAVEVLKGDRVRQFQRGTYPSGDTVLSLYSIGERKEIAPVCGIMQQPDSCKGRKSPAYLFLPGVPATEDVPEQIRADIVVILRGQFCILEL